MAADWVEVPFIDVIEFQEGPGILAKDFRARGTPLVRLGGLERGASVLNGCNYLDPEMVAQKWSHFAMAKGDVLLSTSASLGRIARVDDDGVGAIPYTGIIRMRPRNDRIIAPFIRYLLEGPEFQRQAEIAGVGSVIRHFGPMHLRQMSVRLPPVAEQHAIAHILGTLDDRLELNRRMSQTLDALAVAMFESWRETLEVGRVRVSDWIRDGVLEIGDGYRAKNSELGDGGLPFIRAGDLRGELDTRGAALLIPESVEKAGTKLSRVGDVAFTSKGTVGRFARVTEHTEPFVYSPQICFWRSLAHHRLRLAVLYLWMRSDDFKFQIQAVAGQTDMAPYVSLRDQRAMTIPLFPESQHLLSQHLDTLLKRQALAIAENKTLTSVRDTLLPKLISGELRVRNAESAVEAVL